MLDVLRIMIRIGFYVVLALRCLIANAAPVDATGPESLTGHMHDHYQWATQIQSAIIRGDLAAIAEPAQKLAEHPVPAVMPPAWTPFIEAMRSAARAAGAAKNFTAAAAAASQIATACGNCHVANNISGIFQWSAEPDDELGNVAHMQRHQWAADRMWEGLVGPSDDAWYRGTKLLFEVPLSAQKLNVADDSGNSIREMAVRVHQLAANGSVEFEAAGKAAIYAEFLATCAACHAQLLQGPTD